MDPTKERTRGLTAEGKRIAAKIAAEIAKADKTPKMIFTSPFARAVETGDIYGRALGEATGKAVRVSNVGDFAPDRPLEPGIAGLISTDGLKRVMIVGHVDNTSPCFNTFNAVNGDDWDDLVMGEVRLIEIDRKSLQWTELWRICPSDVGETDYKS